jgi:hypothetical protein
MVNATLLLPSRSLTILALTPCSAIVPVMRSHISRVGSRRRNLHKTPGRSERRAGRVKPVPIRMHTDGANTRHSFHVILHVMVYGHLRAGGAGGGQAAGRRGWQSWRRYWPDAARVTPMGSVDGPAYYLQVSLFKRRCLTKLRMRIDGVNGVVGVTPSPRWRLWVGGRLAGTTRMGRADQRRVNQPRGVRWP